MPQNKQTVSSFTDLGQAYAQAIASPAYERAFASDLAYSQLTIAEEPTSADMPGAV